MSSTPASPKISSDKVVVREVNWDKDLSIVQSIWADGFRLIVPLYFKEIAFAPHIFGIFVAVASALSYVCTGSVIYAPVPLGLAWAAGYLWFHNTVEKSIKTTGVKGMEYLNFWVAEVDGEVTACIGVVDGPAYKAAAHANSAGGDKKDKTETAATEKDGGKAAETETESGASGRKVASVWRLTVTEKSRNLGLGRILMDVSEKWLAEHGYTDVSLLAGHIGSQKFYDKLGYTREKVAWHLGNHESIYFSKKLVA